MSHLTYGDYAADLRLLADILASHADYLPLPRYPEQGLSIDIHVESAEDIDEAGEVLDMTVTHKDNGHTTGEFRVASVELRFVHVSDAAMAEHKVRQAWARTMVTPPTPWADLDMARLGATGVVAFT